MSVRPSGARWRSWLGLAIVGTWTSCTLLATGAIGIVSTEVPPTLAELQRIATASRSLRGERHDVELVVHVIATGCPTADRVFEDLLVRGPDPSADEVVLIVGDDPGRELAALERGFRLFVTDEAGLRDHFGIDVTPSVVVVAPTDNVARVGAYYDQGQPIFRCPVSQWIARH